MPTLAKLLRHLGLFCLRQNPLVSNAPHFRIQEKKMNAGDQKNGLLPSTIRRAISADFTAAATTAAAHIAIGIGVAAEVTEIAASDA